MTMDCQDPTGDDDEAVIARADALLDRLVERLDAQDVDALLHGLNLRGPAPGVDEVFEEFVDDLSIGDLRNLMYSLAIMLAERGNAREAADIDRANLDLAIRRLLAQTDGARTLL